MTTSPTFLPPISSAGSSWMTLVQGTDAAETIVAPANSVAPRSVLFGYGGNDTMTGGAGFDLLYGGDGDDLLSDGGGGGGGLFGGAGNDTLIGQAAYGDVVLDGGTGDDVITYTITPQLSLVTPNGSPVSTTWARLTGGAGADTFQIVDDLAAKAPTGKVILSDFTVGSDKLIFNGAEIDLTIKSDGLVLKNTLEGLSVAIDGSHTTLILSGLTTRSLGLSVDGGEWDVLNGTAGNDAITGSWMDIDGERLGKLTTISAGAGDDLVSGSTLSEKISGGTGNDKLSGNSGADTILGESGNDVLSGGAGRDMLYGGTGSDTISAGSGADLIDGGDGNDVIDAGDGRDSTGAIRQISAGAGQDVISANITYSAAAITLGTGADTVNLTYASSRDHSTSIGAGTVISDFNLFEDTLRINGKEIDLLGTTKSDFAVSWGEAGFTVSDAAGRVIVTLPADTMENPLDGITILAGTGKANKVDLSAPDAAAIYNGLGGNDTIAGGAGTIEILGGDGNDTITLTTSGRSVLGGNGNDVLNGGKTAALLSGGAGNDILYAGSKGGMVSGGDGNDTIVVNNTSTAVLHTLSGGAGADQFIIRAENATLEDATIIEDFQIGVDTLAINGVTITPTAEIDHLTLGSGTMFFFGNQAVVLQDIYV